MASLTRVPLNMVTPEPYVGNPKVTYKSGVLNTGDTTINLDEEVESGTAVVLFIGGICQDPSTFTTEGNKLILDAACEYDGLEYLVVHGNLLQRSNVSNIGTMAASNLFVSDQAPDDSIGKDGDFWVQTS